MANPYPSPPLQSGEDTRMIRVPPGQFNDDIQISLYPVSLSDRSLKFQALSYVWGDPGSTERISCNGQLLKVTVNLGKALRHLRSETDDLVLWADAVCINQNDSAEKGRQVANMGRIYSDAKKVLVWLGRDRNNAAIETVRWAQEMAKEYRRWKGSIFESGNYHKTVPEAVLQGVPGFMDLLNRPWFTRVWTFQELALSRQAEFVCGMARIAYEDVLDAYNLISTKYQGIVAGRSLKPAPYRISTSASSTLFVRDKKRTLREGLWMQNRPFPFLIRLLTRHAATNPLDRVYALLGLADPAIQKLLEPDYNLSSNELWIKVTRAIIGAEKDLSVLENVDVYGQDPTLPSWVLEITKSNTPPLSFKNRRDIRRYRVNGAAFKPPVKLKEEPLEQLTLHGYPIDEIISVHELVRVVDTLNSRNTPKNPKAGVIAVRELYMTIKENSTTLKYESEDLISDIIRTLAADYLPATRMIDEHALRQRYPAHFDIIKSGDRRDAHMKTLYRRVFENTTHKPSDANDQGKAQSLTNAKSLLKTGLFHSNLSLSNEQHDALVLEVLKTIAQVAHHKLLFITAGGRLGLGSCTSKVGDQVYSLLGGNTPFVLRPSKDGVFQFVGECYVHGIMDGELFSFWNTKNHAIPKDRNMKPKKVVLL